MELEPSQGNFTPQVDQRPRMDEPIPVRLVAVADVRLLTTSDNHDALHHLYVRLLEFVPDAERPLVYHANNFSIHFEVRSLPIEYPDLKPLAIEVSSLIEAEKRLYEAEIFYTRQRQVNVGHESLLLRDPGGNWIELVESRQVM